MLYRSAWRPGTVFLASSDFTHYGSRFGFLPFPAGGDVAERLRELDYACIDAAGSLDSTLFQETIDERRANVCGTAPIALLLDVLRALGTGGRLSERTRLPDFRRTRGRLPSFGKLRGTGIRSAPGIRPRRR